MEKDKFLGGEEEAAAILQMMELALKQPPEKPAEKQPDEEKESTD